MEHLPLPGLMPGDGALPSASAMPGATAPNALLGHGGGDPIAPLQNGRRRSLSGGGTVSKQFVTAVRELMSELEETSAHFVRCIKPNAQSVPQQMQPAFALNQLRYSGTTAALRMLHSSYPVRIPYNELYSRYRSHVPSVLAKLAPPEFAESLALALDVPPSQYALGHSMLFLRSGGAIT